MTSQDADDAWSEGGRWVAGKWVPDEPPEPDEA